VPGAYRAYRNHRAPELRSTVDLPDAKAHNITVDFETELMFVIHSGPNNDGELNRNVAIVDISGEPEQIRTVDVGKNPLGVLLVDNR